MCGRFALEVLLNQLQTRYDIEDIPAEKWRPSYNIAPEQSVPIIFNDAKNQLELSTWGFTPHWDKSHEKIRHLINARAETVSTSPMFRHAFENNRCLIPFTHFFEWKKERTKIPYAIGLEKKEIGSFAGIYSEIHGKRRFAILTTAPNELMKPIHNRMPVILPKSKEKEWMKPENNIKKLEQLLGSYDSKKMNAYAISTLVNSPRNNSPDVLSPARNLQQNLFG